MKKNSRRQFIKATGQVLLLAPVASSFVGCSSTKASSQNNVENKSSNTSHLVLNVRDFGAIGVAPSIVIAARSKATKQSIYPRQESWIASLRSQ